MPIYYHYHVLMWPLPLIGDQTQSGTDWVRRKQTSPNPFVLQDDVAAIYQTLRKEIRAPYAFLNVSCDAPLKI